jgi:UDP-perosamine 4-acetyltransferase
MSAPRCVILGGGGHARVIIDALRAMRGTGVPPVGPAGVPPADGGVIAFDGRDARRPHGQDARATPEPAAILDANTWRHGGLLDGVPILGSDAELARLRAEGWTLFVMGLGGAGDNAPRRRVYEFALGLGFQPVTVIHPRAIVSPTATLGAGAQILAGAIVCAGAVLGANVLVNSGAIVEHDCVIGDHVHVASGACLCGGVTVGEGAHLGARCVVRQLVSIGASALVAAGAVVVKEVAAGQKVAGVPARPWPVR